MSEREYVFIIKNEDATTEEKETPVAGDNSVQRQPPAESNEKAGGSKTAGVAFAAVSTVESFVVPVVNHEINKVELATGSREYSQRIQFGMQVGQSVFDVGKTVAAGAFVGGGPGAIVGLVLGAARQLMNLAMNIDTFNLKRNLEYETINRNVRRAGTNRSRSANQ